MNGALRGGHGTIKPLNELTATEITEGIGQGRITCEAVVQAGLERVDAREREVHAWAYIDATTALVSARAFDKNGRVTRRSTLDLMAFGMQCEEDDRPGSVGRRRRPRLRDASTLYQAPQP